MFNDGSGNLSYDYVDPSKVKGGGVKVLTSSSTAYTVNDADYIILVTGSSGQTINFPTPTNAANDGRVIMIRNATAQAGVLTAQTITITTTGGGSYMMGAGGNSTSSSVTNNTYNFSNNYFIQANNLWIALQ